jgi:hypothetical protein
MQAQLASVYNFFDKSEAASCSDVRNSDLERQQSSTEGGSSTDQWNGSHECRICLSAGDASDLVRPCSCSGTLSYTHIACLSAWVQERGSLVCELCGQHYKEPHAQQLELVAAAAIAASKTTNAQGTATTSQPPDQPGSGKWSVACVL